MSYARQRRRFEVYPVFANWMMKENPHLKQLWRWRLLAANNHTMAESSREFPSIRQARLAVKSVRRMMSLAGVIVINAKNRVEYEA